ncbi:hypothetical protein [Streptomyces qinglanensis]|uniref:Uncharacterized protein n=1 Tax=Streptomyces qinglanensis TaxID=943816 RepID=A0A1H9V9D5_9ACTN|nr:hypothetical protein [Streptomyces qinglanensis]SES18024.1 hypothetical protein SAMN05421870_1117 [Streptomyces qinglanensis]
MGALSRTWNWHQFKFNTPQRLTEERESRDEEIKIRRRILLTLPIQDPSDRERLIDAAQSAAIGVFLPAWMRQRHDRFSIIGAGAVSAGSATLLLWLLNGQIISNPFMDLQPTKSSGLPILEQAEIALTLMATGTLWASRRAALSILRDRLHGNPESEKSRFDFLLISWVSVIGFTLIGLPWVAFSGSNNYREWPTGWQVLSGGSFLIGVALRRWTNAFRQLLDRYARAEYEKTTDQVVWRLHYLSWILHARRPHHLKPHILRQIRTLMDESARTIEMNPVPIRTAHWRERTLRRQIRCDHARIAAALRGLSGEIAKAHSIEQYDRVCASVLAGAISAAHGKWDELLANTPEVTPTSRFARSLRRAAPSCTLIAAALTIPVLPGVGPASDGIRVLLLATAVFAALPATDATRDILKGALDKALIKGSDVEAAKNN